MARRLVELVRVVAPCILNGDIHCLCVCNGVCLQRRTPVLLRGGGASRAAPGTQLLLLCDCVIKA